MGPGSLLLAAGHCRKPPLVGGFAGFKTIRLILATVLPCSSRNTNSNGTWALRCCSMPVSRRSGDCATAARAVGWVR